MNGQAILGAEMKTFRLTNVILERIIFVSRGITVSGFSANLDGLLSLLIQISGVLLYCECHCGP